MRPVAFVPAVAALMALASVVFLGKSYEVGLRGIDSNIHAAVAMSVTSGNGMAPRLPIPIKNFAASAPAQSGGALDPDKVFNDHPFFVFWLNGWVMRALGPSGWSARILTALFSVGSVALVLLIGMTWVSRAFAVTAALLLIFCRDFILTSATMSLDTALVFFILLTFYLWLRKRWIALGIAAGVGLWVKTPLVLLVYAVAVVDAGLLALRARSQRLRGAKPVRVGQTDWVRLACSGAIALGVGSLIWIYTGMVGGWELVSDYWGRQLWGTAVGGRGAAAQGWDWGRFFFYNVRTGFLPGLPLLILALARVLRKGRVWQDSVRLPLIAVGVIAFVVTGLRFKLGHYFTPVFPFLALLAAHLGHEWLGKREARYFAAVATSTPLLLAFLLVNPVSFGPEAFLALRRFAPYIQTRGACSDVIALVPGGEPVGSELDAKLYLGFYTGRTVEVIGCDAISSAMESAQPTWVIVAHENLRCLSARARSGYPGVMRVGTQYLMSPRAFGTVVDLTPLALDNQAVTDCRAPAYPRDLWHRYVEGGS